VAKAVVAAELQGSVLVLIMEDNSGSLLWRMTNRGAVLATNEQ